MIKTDWDGTIVLFTYLCRHHCLNSIVVKHLKDAQKPASPVHGGNKFKTSHCALCLFCLVGNYVGTYISVCRPFLLDGIFLVAFLTSKANSALMITMTKKTMMMA